MLELGAALERLTGLRADIHDPARGYQDRITPPEQVWALADLVATPAEDISRELVDAGHLGLFMGRAALEPIAERVRMYSERGA